MSFVLQVAINCLAAHKQVAIRSVVRCKGFHSNSVTCNKDVSSHGAKNYIPVADFYKGKSVFVTGGTGFLGMVLVEKLLYTCTGIEKIFMLVREKKGVSPEQRMQQLVTDPLFQRLKDEKSHFFNKLVLINGDISDPNLGISDKDMNILTDEVSVVFHSAATVRINDKLSIPLKLNFEATMQLLDLSKKMKNLEMFVHISTLYANVTNFKDGLKEILYPPPASLDEIYDFVAKYDNDEEMTTKFLNGKFNTYTFTKALTEYHVAKNKEHVPTIIVRPAIVTAIADGPVPGWINDWQGATRTLHNVSMGHMRVLPGKRGNMIDFIPVDHVINLIIAAATKSDGTKDVPIYNCNSSYVNPIAWSAACPWFTEDVVRRGKNEFPLPFAIFAESKIVLWILTAVMQLLPAYIGDIWLRITGRQPRYILLHKRVMSLRNGIEYFLRLNAVMENPNMLEVEKSLSDKDRELFPCNPADIKWREYMHVYAQGVEKFLLKSANKK